MTSGDFELAIEGLKALCLDDLATTAELGRDRILLWLFDNDPQLLGNNVNVLTVPAPSAITMETVLEVNVQAVPFELIEKSITAVGGRESGRLLFDLQKSGLPALSLQYYVRASSRIWVATLTCLQQPAIRSWKPSTAVQARF
jgi:hypothetical protein